MARSLRRAAAVLAVALVAAACGGGRETGPSTGTEGGRVSFQFFGDAEEAAVYERVAEAFTAKTGTAVDLIPVADRDSHLAKLTTSFAARRPPDVFLLNYRNFGAYHARRVLEPVGARVAASPTLAEEDFYPSPLEAFKRDGELQCLPQNASSLVVYVNRDLFERAGIEPPAGPWTFDEFLATARRLRDALPSGGSAVGLDPGLIRLAPFVWSAGGELTDDEAEPTRFTFATPQARAGLGRFLAIHRDGLTPTEAAVEAQGLDERFISGQLGMFLSSRREVPAFREIEGFEWDVAPLPSAERDTSVLHSDAFCQARGPNADRAWRFAEFAGGPEGQKLLAEGGRIVPSLRSVAESPAFLRSGQPPRSNRVFLDAIPRLRRLPNTKEWPRIEDAASLAFKRAFYDELTVEAAIARIEAETAGLF